MGFARQHKAKLIGALLAAALVGAAVVIALTSPNADAATPSSGTQVVQLCSTAAVGQARCLAERQAVLVPVTSDRLNNSRSAPGNPSVTAIRPNGAAPAYTPGGYGPADLADAYQLDTGKGFGQTVAIIDAYDDPTAAADLAVYRSQYGLPACTIANGCLQKLNQNGATSPLPVANSGWAGEISLDLDMVSAVCPLCNIMLIEANSSYLSDLGTAVDTAVRLGAKFVSNSYGSGEYSGVDGNDVHFNHPGVAITVSTGDNGYGVSYPASSPYVTAVGGTTLLRSAGTTRGWSEAAWAGAGSGCSGYESKPAVQTMTSCVRRAVADVSAVANPNTGVAVYGGGGWGIYGGTSASAPIIAATYALAGTPGATDYPNTYPYANASSLNDITSGSNGSCGTAAWCAGKPGWDGPTGLGTPNSAAAFSATGIVSGTPAHFGAIGKITSAQIAGLPVGISLTPMVPDGDQLVSVTWKAARTDCTFASSTVLATTVTCPATLLGTTTVTGTVTDSAGLSKIVTLSLSFGTVTTKRSVSIALNLAGQTGTAQSMCSGVLTPTRASVLDDATGQPIKGMTVTFTKQTGTTAAAGAGSAQTVADGTATVNISGTAAMNLGARTAAVGPFAAAAATTVAVTVGKCTTTLTASMNQTQTYYGNPVQVTGMLTRDAGGAQVPLANAVVQLTELANGKTIVLGTATSTAAGVLSATVKPTLSGSLVAALPAGTGWTAAAAPLGKLDVLTPATAITAQADRLDVGYGDAITVTGRLSRITGASSAPLAKTAVSIRSTDAGRVTVLGAAITAADGSYSAIVHPKLAGTLSAAYAGAAGQPGTSADIGALTVGTWAPTVTLAVPSTAVTAGSGLKLSGTVSRSYAGQISNGPSVPVGIYLRTTSGALTLLSTLTTNASGVFSGTVTPTESGSLVARVHAVAGYTDADSADVLLEVATRITVTAPSVVTGGRPAVLTVALLAPRAGLVTVQELVGGSWLPVGDATATTGGRATVSLSGPSLGNHSYRASFGGDSRGEASVSATVVVVVKA